MPRTCALDEAIGRIRSGNMLDALLGEREGRALRLVLAAAELPDAPESRYLYTVLAGHDFQEGLKNYRDLSYLGQHARLAGTRAWRPSTT